MAKKRPSPRPVRTALVVLGMHRSGTSALAGVLGHMGCDLPKDLMPPAEMNAKGFFESDGITALNEELLASAGQTWYSFPAFPQEWFRSPKAAEFTERAVEKVEESFGRSHLYVLKDPRICRLLPLWIPALERTGSEPCFVCTHRNPLDVASSLHRWANYEPVYGMMLWLRHVLEAEAATRGSRRVFVSYDQLMSDWAGTMRRIGKGLDLTWPRAVETVTPAVQDFLSESLRHFHKAPAEALLAGNAPEWVADTYKIVERWSQDGEDQADFERLDKIRSGFNASSRSYAPIAERAQALRVLSDRQRTDLEQSRAQQGLLSEQYGAVLAERDAAREQHLADQNNRAALEAEIARITAALDAARAESAGHCHNHATEQAMRGQAEQRLAAVTEALDAAKAEVNALSARIGDAESARACDSQVIAELHAEIEARQQEMQALAAEGDETKRALQQDLADARAKLQDEELRVRDAAETCAQMQSEIARLEVALASEQHARQQLESALRQRQQEAADHNRLAVENAEKFEQASAALREVESQFATLKRRADRDARHLANFARLAADRMRSDIDSRLAAPSPAAGASPGNQAEIEAQAAEIRSLQDALIAANSEREAELARMHREAEERLEQVRGELRSAQTQLASHEAERASAGIERAHLLRSLEKSEAALRSSQTRLATHETERANAGIERAHLLRSLEKNEAALRSAQTSQAELERRLAEVEAHRRQLLESTSWRLTEPLRRIVRAVRRDRR